MDSEDRRRYGVRRRAGGRGARRGQCRQSAGCGGHRAREPAFRAASAGGGVDACGLRRHRCVRGRGGRSGTPVDYRRGCGLLHQRRRRRHVSGAGANLSRDVAGERHRLRDRDRARWVGAGAGGGRGAVRGRRSEEHTSALQSLMRISYAPDRSPSCLALVPSVVAVLAGCVAIGGCGVAGADLVRLSSTAAGAAFFINAGVVGMYPVLAQTCPATLRASGTGFVIGIGRGGSALGPVVAGALFAGGSSLLTVSLVMGLGGLVAAAMILMLPRS